MPLIASLGLLNATGFGLSTSGKKSTVVFAHDVTPFISAYPWSSGFGTKYANPTTLPTGAGLGVNFRPDGTSVVLSHSVSPFTSAYPWSSSGFGTKYANPSVPPSDAPLSVNFNPTGTVVAFPNTVAGVIAYAWSSGFGTKYANPATIYSDGYFVTFNPAGTVIAVGGGNSGGKYLYAYPWSSGFGTKYTDPTSQPALFVYGVGFNPTGTAIVTAHTTTPFTTAYPWSSGFGTKYASPSTLPTGNCDAVKFTTSGSQVLIGQASGTGVRLSTYAWSNGYSSKTTNTAPDIVAQPVKAIALDSTSSNIFLAGNFTGVAYTLSSGVLGTKYTNPSPQPSTTGYGVSFTL